jgi:hypothetical protein
MDKEERQQATLRHHRKETKHRRILQHSITNYASKVNLGSQLTQKRGFVFPREHFFPGTIFYSVSSMYVHIPEADALTTAPHIFK